jgi:sugar phosphate isomerase/epimerase
MTKRRPLGYIVWGSMNQWAPEDVLNTLAGAGVQSIDWGQAHFDPLTDPASKLVDLVATTAAAGMTVGQLSMPQDFVVTDDEAWSTAVRRTELAIDACAEAGIASVGVVTGPLLWNATAMRIGVKIDERTAWDRVLTALGRLADRAAERNIMIGVEPVWGTLVRSAYRIEHLFVQLDRPALGLTLDPSHLVLTNDDTPSFIRRWAHPIVHVHIKDAFGSDGMHGKDFLFTLPGEGGVDWAGFFEALNEVGYSGPLTIENEASKLIAQSLDGDAGEGARLSISLGRSLIERFDTSGEQAA